MIMLKSLLERIPIEFPKRFLYHGTFRAFLPSIKKRGLLPLGGNEAGNYKFEMLYGVYLTDLPSSAGYFAEMAQTENEKIPEEWLDEKAILTINIRKLDKSKFEEPYVYDKQNIFLYKDAIPPTAIVNVEYTNRWGNKLDL